MVAQEQGVSNDSVVDKFGGYCGVPSSLVVTAVAASTRVLAAAAATTTTTTTNTTNTTAVSNKTWTAGLYVQPSLTAAKVDNAATKTALLGLTAKVDKITSAKFGSVALTAAEMKEAKVGW